MAQRVTSKDLHGYNEQNKKEFILEKHIKPLEEASQKSNFAVSFRKAGKPTLDCLKDGAGAKPHSILEKTIKESSLKKYYSENYSEVAAKIKNANIEGLAGHRDDEKGLVGLYLTTNEEIESELITVGEHVVYPIDMSNLEGSLANLKRVKNWKSGCYTGDYDTHDVIIFNGAGRPRKVLNDSLEEQSVIKILNDAVEKVDAPRRHISHTHRVIQHGPRVNYPSHMVEFERAENKPLVPAVANPGEFPIMMLDRGKWILIENKDELAEYYKNVGAVIKDGWSKNPSVTYTEQGIKPGGSSGH
ncbi:Insecticial toxin [Erwinia mallotivora]|uniref:Insecticial toxin n=1 Tax=Erwinia mallotivora TaxID=69222 RepID=UPI0035E6A5B2